MRIHRTNLLSKFLLPFVCVLLITFVRGHLYATPPHQQLAIAKHDTIRLRLLTELSFNYRYFNPDSSLIFTKMGFQLAHKLKSTQHHCQLYTCLGYYHRNKKQFDKAIKSLQLASYYGNLHHQYNLVEISHYMLAVAYADKAYTTGSLINLVKTIRQIFNNLTYSNEHQSFAKVYANYSLLAAIYKDNGNDSLALLYMEKQLPYLKHSNAPHLKQQYLVNSFQVYLRKKDKEAYSMYLEQFLKYDYKPQELSLYNYLLSLVITEFILVKDFDSALKLIQKIMSNPKIMEKLDPHWKFQFNNNLATIYLHKNNFKLAQQAFERAVFFSKEEVLPYGDQFKLMVNQQQLLEHQKRFEEALKLNKRIHSMQDSLTSARFRFELATSEERLEHENKERIFQQQLKIKQLDNQRKTEALDNARQLQWIFTLLVLLLIIIVVIFGLQLKKIRQQSRILSQLNAAKNQLFAIIGHDLRSPILALQGALERISSSSTEIQTMLPRINSLLLTTDNLLYWAESQQNNAKYQPQNTAISDIIAEVLALLETSIEAAQLQIIDEVPDSVLVKADENHLRIIIRNVVQNAIKFTPTNGSIRFTTQQLAKATELRIEDTGIGYEQTQKENPFKSTQLGLKLVRNLIAINKGSFSIQNNNTQGTIVSIILPLPS